MLLHAESCITTIPEDPGSTRGNQLTVTRPLQSAIHPLFSKTLYNKSLQLEQSVKYVRNNQPGRQKLSTKSPRLKDTHMLVVSLFVFMSPVGCLLRRKPFVFLIGSV